MLTSCRLVRPGDYVLDVGANVGYFTLMFTQIVGASGRVKAFEANPRVHKLTAATIELQGHASRTQVGLRLYVCYTSL